MYVKQHLQTQCTRCSQSSSHNSLLCLNSSTWTLCWRQKKPGLFLCAPPVSMMRQTSLDMTPIWHHPCIWRVYFTCATTPPWISHAWMEDGCRIFLTSAPFWAGKKDKKKKQGPRSSSLSGSDLWRRRSSLHYWWAGPWVWLGAKPLLSSLLRDEPVHSFQGDTQGGRCLAHYHIITLPAVWDWTLATRLPQNGLLLTHPTHLGNFDFIWRKNKRCAKVGGGASRDGSATVRRL